MQDLTILADFPPLPAEKIEVIWRAELPEISPAARHYIDARWSEYESQAAALGKSLFNDEITCLVAANFANGKLTLELGPSNYKDFLVTVLRDRPWFLQNEPSAIRPALGNSALLTHRHHALLGIRSHRVSAYAGRAHVIGGVLERLGTDSPSVNGILAHLTRELLEEAAIHPHELAGPPKLLALVRDENLAQPELIWQCELTVPIPQVATRLTPEEHSAFEILEKFPIPPELWSRMTPVAHCAWQRWQS